MKRYEQVRRSCHVWQALGVSDRVLSWIKFGVLTTFVGGVPAPYFNFVNSDFHEPARDSAWLAIQNQYFSTGGLKQAWEKRGAAPARRGILPRRRGKILAGAAPKYRVLGFF